MRVVYALTALIMFSATPTWAALSCTDAGAVDYYNSAPSDPDNGSGNYTPPATANRITLTGYGQRRGSGALSVTNTLGGISTAQVSTTGYQDPAGASLFYIVNAAASSSAVSVDPSGTPLASAAITLTCTGANTALDGASSTPFRSVVSNAGSGTTATCTPGTVTATDIVVTFMFKDNSANFTLGGNETLVKQGNDGAESAAIMSTHSGSLGAAATNTLTSEQWACVSVVVRAADGRNRNTAVLQ